MGGVKVSNDNHHRDDRGYRNSHRRRNHALDNNHIAKGSNTAVLVHNRQPSGLLHSVGRGRKPVEGRKREPGQKSPHKVIRTVLLLPPPPPSPYNEGQGSEGGAAVDLCRC
jgi:hypothetical protein